MRAIYIQRHATNAGRELQKWKRFRNKRKNAPFSTFYNYGERRPVQFVIREDKNG